MKQTVWCLVTFLLVVLCAGIVVGLPWPPPSPLTLLSFDNLNHTLMNLSLPWYLIESWEVSVCTQDLSSSVGAISSANDVTDMSLSTPIYMDTITLLAKKSPYSDGVMNGYYYEVGWYVQPFQGQMDVNLYLFDWLGHNITLASGSASDQTAFDGYQAFPVPCDPKVFTGKCVGLTENVTRARLEWWTTNGTNEGPHQFLESKFILVNETNQ